ncbi:MAG TPA: hypothetical protein VK430_02625 [Xanthobacteraceae bacterium]|nr:hypothetical protein [Xanthobacteraceae bacterium]
MRNKSEADDGVSRSPIENLAKQVGILRTIVAALVAILAVAFTAGIFWERLITYERLVDEQQKQIEGFEHQLNFLKSNLSNLSDPSYQIEISNDPEGSRCEQGNVVTGLRYDSQRIWMRCASLGRAAYNPTPATK